MNEQPTPIPLELLKIAIASEHIAAIRTGKNTHEPCLKLVGRLVHYTQEENLIERIVSSFFPPDYDGDSIKEIARMVQDAVKKGFHKNTKGQKKKNKESTIAQECLSIVQDRGIHLFHDKLHQGYISVTWAEKGQRTFRLKSSAAEQWLRRAYYETAGKPLAAQSLKDTIDTLEAKAIFDGPLEPVFVRTAKLGDRIYIDLGTDDGSVIHVSAEGWSTVADAPVRFVRPTGFGELPVPEGSGDLDQFKSLLSLDGGNWVLLLAFILNCLKADGPFMCLIIEGEQGSGKSLLCELLKYLLDPSAAPKLRLPKDEHSLMIQASQNALLVFDNVSTMKWDMSDALCALSTGSGFSTRKYYTDDDARVFQFCRPYVLNGIGEYASRPDLLERAIYLKLPPLPKGQRRTERDIWAEFHQRHAGWLGCLLDMIVVALQRYDSIESPTTIRMADSARWLKAAEPATSFPTGTFISALEGSQEALMADRIANDPLTLGILAVIEHGPFEGTVGELYEKLTLRADRHHALPVRTSAHLSTALKRARPALETIGVHVTFGKHTRKGRMITITADEYDDLRDDI